MPSAEFAYLFRHALMRDAAYELQLPGDRAALHVLVVDLVEVLYPEHERRVFANELADHLERARMQTGDDTDLPRERDYTRAAALVAQHSYQNAESIRLWRRLAAICEPGDALQAYSGGGAVAYYSGDRAVAEKLFKRGLELARELDDRDQAGVLESQLGILFTESSRLDEAAAAFARAKAILEDMPAASFESALRNHLTTFLKRSGRLDEAERMAELSISRARRDGNLEREVTALTGLAGVHQSKGELAESEELLLLCLEIQQQLDDVRSLAYLHSNLAMLCAFTGRPERAEELYRKAIDSAARTGEAVCLNAARGNLAYLLSEGGRYDEAEHLFIEALAGHRELGDHRFLGVASCDYALLKHARGDKDALDSWLEGLDILHDHGLDAGIPQVEATMKQFCTQAGVPALPMSR